MDAQIFWGCSVVVKKTGPNLTELLNNAFGLLLRSPPCARHTCMIYLPSTWKLVCEDAGKL